MKNVILYLLISSVPLFGFSQGKNKKQPSWLEEFMCEASKHDRQTGILEVKILNSGKNVETCMEKAKEQVLYQAIFNGFNNELIGQLDDDAIQKMRQKGLIIEPIPYVIKNMDVSNKKDPFYVFLKKTGLINISNVKLDPTINVGGDGRYGPYFGFIIELNLASLKTQLEALNLKNTNLEELGNKPRIIYLPTGIGLPEGFGDLPFRDGDGLKKLFNEESSDEKVKSEYLEQFQILRNSATSDCEFISLMDYRDQLFASIQENEGKPNSRKESILEIISRIIPSDGLLFNNKWELVQGPKHIVSSRFLLIDPFSLNSSIRSETIQLELFQSGGYDASHFKQTINILFFAEDVFHHLIKKKSVDQEFKVLLTSNARLTRVIKNADQLNEKKTAFYNAAKDYFKNSIEKNNSAEANLTKLSVNLNPKLKELYLRNPSLFEEFKKIVAQQTGLTLEIDYKGNHTIYLELTDMNRLDRKKRIKEEYANCISVNNMEAYRTFLTDFYDSEETVDISNRYNQLILDKLNNKLTTEEYDALLKDAYCTSSRDVVIKKFVESVIPSNWNTISSLDEMNKVFQHLNELNDRYSLELKVKSNYLFPTTTFDSKKWTFENLSVSHFSNGDTIYEARSNEEWIKAYNEGKPAWCYYDNDPDKYAYGYGKLYNYFVLTDKRGIEIGNYRIADLNDFNQLTAQNGGENQAAKKLKCGFRWDEEYDELSGFDALPGGYRSADGLFNGESNLCSFWTKTEMGNEVLSIQLKKGSNAVFQNKVSKGAGLSVRLIEKENVSSSRIIDVIEQLKQKRDQLILEQIKLKANEEAIDNFLYSQVSAEYYSSRKNLRDIERANINALYHRAFDNPKLLKNGIFLNYVTRSKYPSCGADGDGGDPNPITKIGFSNNVMNYAEWEDGTIFKGAIKEGMPSGNGLLKVGEAWAEFYGAVSGATYEGVFDDGYMTDGKINYPNKNIYVGKCDENVPNGQGRLTLANGKVLNGKFSKGEYVKPFECNETKIGNQVWMAENLKVTKFRNGDPIYEARSKEEWYQAGLQKKPAFCYYNNEPSTASQYGVLYNWYAINDSRGLAPEGWKIPTSWDVEALRDLLQKNIYSQQQKIKSLLDQGVSYDIAQKELNKMINCSSTMPGIGLFSKNETIKENIRGTNLFRFNCIKNPTRDYDGDFEEDLLQIGVGGGAIASFWTSSYWTGTNDAMYWGVFNDIGACALINSSNNRGPYYYSTDDFIENFQPKTTMGTGLPVRCIK
jgi:uncharacterized protein (TIGR02145 family)